MINLEYLDINWRKLKNSKMAVLTIPRKTFEKEIGKLDEKLEDKLALFGTSIENKDDENIDLNITPNRPDLLSYSNFRYSFTCYLGKTKPKQFKIQKSGAKIIVDKSVANIRPYSMAAIVKGIKFTDEKIKEIMQFQEKLHATIGRNRKKMAMGYYVLDKIKFPIKYMADMPQKIAFEPLDMPQKMNALQILSRHPAGREYGYQLEGFDKFPVYYDNGGQVLSLPPIINSNNLGKINEKTKDILIECSGTDLETLKKCIAIAVADLINSGGKAYSIDIIYGSKKELIDLKPQKTKLSIGNANKLLGLNIKEAEIKKLLGKMGHEYRAGYVYSPAWRVDILHEVDIIEDIAIAYGYDKIIPEIPQISTIGQIDKKEIIKKKIAEILAGLEMIETSSLHLTTKDSQFKKINIPEEDFIEVQNSKTEYTILRKDLTHCLLRILSENVDVEYPQEIFELGKIFNSNYTESEHLSLALAPGDFTKAKQVLEYLAKMLNINLKIDNHSGENLYCIEGRIADIILNNKKIGFIGDVHPSILKNLKIKMPVTLTEIDLAEIFKEIK